MKTHRTIENCVGMLLMIIALVAIVAYVLGAQAHAGKWPADAVTIMQHDMVRDNNLREDSEDVDYEHTLDIEPSLRSFKVGELIHTRSHPQTTYVVIDYRKLGDEWAFIIRPYALAQSEAEHEAIANHHAVEIDCGK